MSQVGVAEAYIPGLEEIADDFIKLCKDIACDYGITILFWTFMAQFGKIWQIRP